MIYIYDYIYDLLVLLVFKYIEYQVPKDFYSNIIHEWLSFFSDFLFFFFT